jgi:hypothetical protein
MHPDRSAGHATTPRSSMTPQECVGRAPRRTRTRAARRGLLRGWGSWPRPPNHHRRLRGRREVCAGATEANPGHGRCPDPIRSRSPTASRALTSLDRASKEGGTIGPALAGRRAPRGHHVISGAVPRVGLGLQLLGLALGGECLLVLPQVAQSDAQVARAPRKVGLERIGVARRQLPAKLHRLAGGLKRRVATLAMVRPSPQTRVRASIRPRRPPRPPRTRRGTHTSRARRRSEGPRRERYGSCDRDATREPATRRRDHPVPQ